MSDKDYLKDITAIKDMMNKSSRFISLSGLSGILAGIYALIGAFLANGIIKKIKIIENPFDRFITIMKSFDSLFFIAISVILLSIITGIFLSRKKALKNGNRIWNEISKRLLLNFSIPLITGGVLCIIIIDKGIFELISPLTLIFYGLACVNASKYTLGDIRYLGITNIILGLIGTQFVGYGLFFWALGFGVMHIIYGTLMYFKYDRV